MLSLSSSELTPNVNLTKLNLYSPLLKVFLSKTSSLEAVGERLPYWDTTVRYTGMFIPHQEDSSLSTPYFLKETMFDWFQEYWMLHQAKGNYIWTTHADFKLMFLVAMDRKAFYNTMAVSRFYIRWLGGLHLLSNLAFFEASIFAFTSKLFVEEALSFNWHLSYMNYKLFKYSHQLVYFQDSSYGNYTRLAYRLLGEWGADAALVTDVKSHEKNIFYLTRFSYYTIGLAPANYNPWILSFPIPLLGDSILGQYYFIVMAIKASGIGQRARFNQFSSRWFALKTFLKKRV